MAETGSMPPLLDRLRRVLLGSSEAQRPIAQLDLPLNLQRFFTPEALSRLRAAAVLVPVIDHAAGPTILLTRRAENLRHHKGQISLPGGGRDAADASLAAAALREAQEEVGLDPALVDLVGYLDDYPTITGYRITPVVGLVRQAFDPVIDPGEVAETFELPLEVLLAENAFERKSLLRDGFNVLVREINHDGRRIWGATAGILWELRQKMLGHD
ncbi:CoA pyrophosphatase [Nevskia soli]|uniref:CoA pyrophosphatase n=1 Tax=Nevskia soli TaxID=418856 RepID=UPI0006897B5D|nr:CoA pyrophosphatase [Nevskia soli]